jgi:hypothetical protein
MTGSGHEERPSGGESDVDGDDEHQALSRATGGEPQEGAPDPNSTTGSTPNDEFVGRAAGQDVGYEEETGAERREAAGES